MPVSEKEIIIEGHEVLKSHDKEKGEFYMDYDVLILGGGIIGCAVAYELF